MHYHFNRTDMTLERFQQMIATGKPLAGEEMITFMREQSDATRRLLFDLNGSYHSPEEIVALFSRITDNKVDDSFHLFPPFYTDFGKNIHLGKNVFINSCCQFQDQGGIFIGDGTLIGHSVVMATLNHGFAPDDRQNLYHSPIHIGKGVSIGHNAVVHGCTVGDNTVVGMGSILLSGAVVGKNCIIGAGALVTGKMVIPDNSMAFGNPAKVVRQLTAEEVEDNRHNAQHYVDLMNK